ncbi:MAG: SpoIIE family protein phosphatase [Planctomycetia bacterium]|jgi:serine phosphatase RsbU (regulator of sigma subunit)
MAVLRTLQGLQPGQVFTVDGPETVLGRNPDCDIVLEVGAVSRRHARIIAEEKDGGPKRFFIEDLKSRNGTYVNEVKVEGRVELNDHDQIQVCDLLFIFHDGHALSDGTVTIDDQSAMFYDDLNGSGTGSSTVMSKLSVVGGPSDVRVSVRPEVKLKALLEIGHALGHALSPDEVLPKLLDSLFSIFIQADRGFIVLRSPQTDKLVTMALKQRDPDREETIRISRTILRQVMKSKEAILSADAAADSRFNAAESIADFRIRSMMCAPLIGIDGNALGVIQIDTLDHRNRFSRDDLDLLVSVAGQAAYAVENAQLHEEALKQRSLEQELAIAHEVQQGFLPHRGPEIDGYHFFDFYEPANQLGGDYFDYIKLPDGRLAVVLADVSGKGISASLLGARFSAEIRYALAGKGCPTEAVEHINRVFCEPRWEDRFVTMVLVILDLASGRLSLVNAGHMPPLLREPDGTILAAGETTAGLPLGVLETQEYETVELDFPPGSNIILFTDGITEAMNQQNQLYGGSRLWSILDEAPKTIKALGTRILDDVKRFVGTRPQSDDMCLVCVGRE